MQKRKRTARLSHQRRVRTAPNGRKPHKYGDRTFAGWEAYYEVWGVRKPCARTICSHYGRNRALGKTDEEIIEMQKRLWLEGITECANRGKSDV
jgi:hypothetical protein